MTNRIHPIATVVGTTGVKGDVRLRPLSRYCDDYIGIKPLLMGISSHASNDVILENTVGIGKKKRFKFEGIDSIKEAKKVVGQTIYVSAKCADMINLIGHDLLGFQVITDEGCEVGILKDVMWLPISDVYVVDNGVREILIPIISEVVRGVNYKDEYITITPMDGLLD